MLQYADKGCKKPGVICPKYMRRRQGKKSPEKEKKGITPYIVVTRAVIAVEQHDKEYEKYECVIKKAVDVKPIGKQQ